MNKIKMEMKKTAKQESLGSNNSDVTVILKPPETGVHGKKHRLDHLTWEEKLQRKKLKNRVAAQTSRDRKKAKLDELEEAVRRLKEKNELLAQEYAILKAQNEALSSELRTIEKERQQLYCSACQTLAGCTVPLLGSAASPNDPLPQGGTVRRPASCPRLTPGAAVLLKILTFYLLWKNCLTTSKTRRLTALSGSRNWPKTFCAKLPPRFKQLLVHQMQKSQSRKNLIIQQKRWWGRHQKMWRPIELVDT